ncbi:membrane protease YdiL (CAAX protease family) [Streptococcus gallinaceus]|uniref:CPBP family intramembrane glutamic endopeptidase n=1 Tax=Streptococcus gallinaceus TaxID=165758 RepID=UPI0020A08503|nr:type II CAAX endopeptidase family protein [Streptococcus gallinaceus]MCP1639080.1 membrane protease YdiL (CAAX protease family) [Streptococcus gallinaceus]MCP1769676.1 membrane protease YdiL (CAAX protease family) [Streptococcus gallinaceus]
MFKKNPERTKFYYLAAIVLLLDMGIQNMILSLDFIQKLSEFNYQFIQSILTLIIGIFATWIIWKYGNREIFQFQFKGSYIGYFILFLICHIIWTIITALCFPVTQNQSGILDLLSTSDSTTNILVIFSIILISPFCEEMVYRGIIMEIFKPFKKYYLDIVASVVLFSLLHILWNGLQITDFMSYLAPGIILSIYFRKTKCIYYPIIYHTFWNSLPFLIHFLRQVL